MSYHLNYGYIWTHFGKLGWGLVLSLELAFVSILIGMAIGLSLALAYTGGGGLVRRAVEAGGSQAMPPVDHGFMYERSFYDPDGHHWAVFWMDPKAAQG